MEPSSGEPKPYSHSDVIISLLQCIEKQNEKHQAFEKVKIILMSIIAFISLLILIMVTYFILSVVPKFVNTLKEFDQIMEEMDQVMTNIDSITEDTEILMGNIKTISDDIIRADIPGIGKQLHETMTDIQGLVETGQDNLKQAMDKILQIDIDTLNTAIRQLQNVVSPLSNLVSKFR